MRLINVHTLELEDFTAPPDSYAILSHTWGKAQDEVSYQDFQDAKRRKKKPGFAKIEATCTRARENKLDYAWVDTCCIDKSSSAELSEAINSMFEWYRLSSVCYVFLEDVDGSKCSLESFCARANTRYPGKERDELILPQHRPGLCTAAAGSRGAGRYRSSLPRGWSSFITATGGVSGRRRRLEAD
jgi:hypothetical protein